MERIVLVLLFNAITAVVYGIDTEGGKSGIYYSDLEEERQARFLSKPSAVYLYVSPTNGNDSNDGLSTAKPFQTLTKAIADFPNHMGHDVYIELLQGYHDLAKTLYIKNINTSSKLTVRAYHGQEVHVTGGKRLDSSIFKAVTDQRILSRIPSNARSHVRVAKLADLNVTNYGSIGKFGSGMSRRAPLEVFFNGQPLRLARWPNKGYINVASVVHGPKTKVFKYSSQRPRAWKDENEIWTYGTWRYGWADRAMKVQSLNAVSQTVTLTDTTDIVIGHWNDTSNINVGSNKQGGYFRFFNVLSELDEPGEYYLDKTTGNLYVWVPNSSGHIGSSDIVYASMINDCIVLIHDSENIVFQDITLEGCRAHGIIGTNITNLTLNYMEIRNTGGYSIVVNGDGSKGITISRSVLHDGNGAIYLAGGNRNTLESSGHVIAENEIYQYTRYGNVGYRALYLNGAGTQVRNNHIHTSGHGAILYKGNNHVFEYNEVDHVCLETPSCSAFLTTEDWTFRGNILRYNWIHHVLRYVPGSDNKGISLENQVSSTSMKYNVLSDNQIHISIYGGRDNIIENNVMYNATTYAIYVDGKGRYHSYDKKLIQHLNTVPYKSTIWTTMYPEMKDFDHQNKSLPEGNQIVKNLFFDDIHVQTISGWSSSINTVSFYNISENGWAAGPGDFYDINKGDFRVTCSSSEWVRYYHFKQPLVPTAIGPRHPYGPAYKRKAPKNVTTKPKACTTLAPSTNPVGSYLPDGTGTSKLFNITNQGCWLNVPKCEDDPDFVGTYRDMYGENFEHAADNETMCFKRAIEQWRYCGSNSKEQVMAIYGPTGASTIAGEGCVLAQYGCPKHGGPANGTRTPGRFVRDYYAERQYNASRDQEACLNRAASVWKYCGSHRNHPVTAIFKPTGATRTAGAGCWIRIEKCPKHSRQHLYFYDGWGEANMHTDEDSLICFSRALHWWTYCGSDPKYHVTAFFRPTAKSHTVH